MRSMRLPVTDDWPAASINPISAIPRTRPLLLLDPRFEADKKCETPLTTWVWWSLPDTDDPEYTEIAFSVCRVTPLLKALQPTVPIVQAGGVILM
jgi:hypothetical protein